jgi:hypothetical protein
MSMRRLLGAVGVALAVLTGRGDAAQSTTATVTSNAVSDQDVILLVKGWQSGELETILADFERKYGLDDGALQADNTAYGASRIKLRQPLSADRLLYLVNYLHYPEGFELERRSPVAVAIARLSPAFGVTEPPLLGRTAAFYVPADDTRFDEVYATLDDESAFRVPFTNLGWEGVAEGRRSSAVAALQKSAPPL